jgi:hypothetical protein
MDILCIDLAMNVLPSETAPAGYWQWQPLYRPHERYPVNPGMSYHLRLSLDKHSLCRISHVLLSIDTEQSEMYLIIFELLQPELPGSNYSIRA